LSTLKKTGRTEPTVASASKGAPLEETEAVPHSDLTRIPKSVEEFLADLLGDFAPAATTNDGASATETDVGRWLDAGAHLFRAAFECTDSPLRRDVAKVGVGLSHGWATHSPFAVTATPGEALIRETAEGQRLLQALRETVPQFSTYEHAGYFLDRLMTRVFRNMAFDQRAALLRRWIELCAAAEGLRAPEIGDSALAHEVARLGMCL